GQGCLEGRPFDVGVFGGQELLGFTWTSRSLLGVVGVILWQVLLLGAFGFGHGNDVLAWLDAGGGTHGEAEFTLFIGFPRGAFVVGGAHENDGRVGDRAVVVSYLA